MLLDSHAVELREEIEKEKENKSNDVKKIQKETYVFSA